MTNVACPNCGKKQFNPSSRKCYACRAEQRPDGSMLVVPDGYILDQLGNLRTPVRGEVRDGKLFVSFHYVLEPGKTTPRGEHPKLAAPPQCIHPERLSCNYGEGFSRCQFMEHQAGRWTCTAKP